MYYGVPSAQAPACPWQWRWANPVHPGSLLAPPPGACVPLSGCLDARSVAHQVLSRENVFHLMWRTGREPDPLVPINAPPWHIAYACKHMQESRTAVAKHTLDSRDGGGPLGLLWRGRFALRCEDRCPRLFPRDVV